MFQNFRLLHLDLIILAIFTTQVESDWRIVGGRSTKFGEVPFIASIQFREQHICGGTLISKRVVLSAAHCFKECTYDNMKGCLHNYRVLLGDISLPKSNPPPISRQVLKVNQFIAHEFYRPPEYNYDIELLVLATNVKLSRHVGVARLARIRPFPGKRCIVSGWGRTGATQPRSNTLMVAYIMVQNTRICTDNLQSFRQDTMICAGDLAGKNDSCQGDSGGPLICDSGEVTGVVSFGVSCALPKFAASYTDVARFQDWIDVHVAEVGDSAGQITTKFAHIIVFCYHFINSWEPIFAL